MGFIHRQSTGGVLTWTLDRPSRLNAIGTGIAAEFADLAATYASQTPSPRILCLRAKPVSRKKRRFWIAGGDLKELAGLSNQQASLYIESMTRFTTWLIQLPIPVIAVVEGEAIGGGAELALAADIRLATSDACLHFKQIEIGLATGYGGAHRLVDLVGLAHAQRLLLKAAPVKSTAALELGLFHECAPQGSVEDLLRTWTEHFLKLGREALGAQKRMLHAATHSHPGSRSAQEYVEFIKIWRSPEHTKFLDRFMGRSSP